MRYAIKVNEIFGEEEIIKNAYLVVNNNLIEGIYNESIDCETINLENYKIIPGLIDMHIHGVNGFDTMDGSYDSLNEMSKHLAKNGVTAFLPTTVTANWNRIINAVINVKDGILKGVEGADILGSYIEGPYISEKQKGAHAEEFIRDISINELKELVTASENTIRIITLAPELEGALEAIRFLKGNNINISMGHTDAKSEDIKQAVGAGANIAVHIFNGMRGIHHREPGAAGAFMLLDEIYTELIADGIHVHPDIIKILLRCKGSDKICLITDCMMAGGLSDGEYMLGELKVVVKDAICRISNGALAGSTLRLIDGVKNLIRFTDINPLKAVHSASLVPAKVIGIDDKLGSIRTGKVANLTIVDDDYNAVMTIVNGKVVYVNEKALTDFNKDMFQ
ncbi:MAG: N-acetylglucosamine-6-phosphate deacetylase [Clostridiales bacterium]|nr:N-acetylglucosamine-6-phosphate deacetylase [Clostridiales bacterium]